MRVTDAPLRGLKVVETRIFKDERGHFVELWNARRYAEGGLDREFVQDNVSTSRQGVIRGLHYQHPNGQAKLISVLAGEIWDVAVDVRRGSPTFGKWFGLVLSAENGKQLYIPEGLAHGFAAVSHHAVISYKCTAFHDPKSERTLLWNDPVLGIDWPISDPVLSDKDRLGMRLAEIGPEGMPSFE